MEIRPSGKIAIGIIAALGTIAVLHLLIFKKRATEYTAALRDFEAAKASYEQRGTAPAKPETFRFRYQTLKYQLDFWQALDNLRVSIPQHYLGIAPEMLRRQRQDFWDFLEFLDEHNAAQEQPRLIFTAPYQQEQLQAGSTWNLLRQLPSQLTNQGVVEDRVQQLADLNELLDHLDQETELYEAQSQTYENQLLNLGLNINERNYIKENYGEVPATLFTLNRIKLIMDALPEDFFLFVGKDQEERRALMYELFRIEWPETGNLVAYRQIQALKDIIEASRENGLQQISEVRMEDAMDIFYPPPSKVEKEEEEEQPGPGGRVYPGGPGGGRGNPYAARGREGWGTGGRGQPQTQGRTAEPADDGAPEGTELAAKSVPIIVTGRGANRDVSSVLYYAANVVAPMEIDSLVLGAVPQSDGQVNFRAFVNVVAYVVDISSTKDGLLTPEQVDRNLVKTKRQLYEVAQKVGAMELAAEDGLVEIDEARRAELIVPMPTPYPSPTPTATPTPAPAP